MKQKRYIFNASFYVTPDYRPQWEEWLNNELFPFVSKKVPESETEVFEVFSDVNQDLLVFSVQFRCNTPVQVDTLKNETISVFNDFRAKFGERVTNFNSILNKID
jgi:hypothetical protein